MSEKPNSTIQVICPCCSATLTIDPTLSAVLNHKLPAKADTRAVFVGSDFSLLSGEKDYSSVHHCEIAVG